MKPEFKKAVQQARKLETDGIDFYTKLAEKCASPAGKQMFASFASDEKRHLKIIKQILEGMGVAMKDVPMPRDTIRTLFTEAMGKMGEYADATKEEREAIQIALGMETQSYNLYAGSAKDAGDEQTRKLFERLAREENQHYEMLENTLEYLNSNEKWFLWKEWALISGDQSSLSG